MIKCEGKQLYIDNISIGIIYNTDIMFKNYWLFYRSYDSDSYQLITKNNKSLRKLLKEYDDKVIINSNKILYSIRKY